MASSSISPLRYQKGGNASSSNKVPGSGRPLSELSPMAIRRNSPSFPQNRGTLFKNESSPAGSSPFSNGIMNSPRLFWQGRDPASPSRENKDPNDPSQALSPTKRSSIENLKKASRVKNSNMFAKELQNNYDPARPNILDGKPLGAYQGNAFGARPVEGNFVHPNDASQHEPHHIIAQATEVVANPSSLPPLSPSKMNLSPAKSSLSKRTGADQRYSGFDPETGIWEDEDDPERKLPEGRGLHRHAKSVTFDQAPPQINEYEMTTPVPSSIASESREGSYDLGEDDEDDLSFERGSSYDHDDSFDASLEDIEKTPIVLPEDWRFMSPDIANTELAQHGEDVFDDGVGSPEPDIVPNRSSYRAHQTRINSVDSNGQTRPLPPLPAAMANFSNRPGTRDSLSGAIERMSNGHRALPSPPPAASISKSDLRRMSGGSLSIEDRLKLMIIKDEEKQKADAESQHEQRMRRTESKDLSEVREDYWKRKGGHMSDGNTDNTKDHLAPRLSRISILQQLRGVDSQDDMSAPRQQISQSPSLVYDPDVPIPSLEDPTVQYDSEVDIKAEDSDAVSLASIPSYYGLTTEDQYVSREEEPGSCTSNMQEPGVLPESIDEGQVTPRAHTPDFQLEQIEDLQEKALRPERISLPDFSDFGQDNSFDLGLHAYMTPPEDEKKSSPLSTNEDVQMPNLAALREAIQRPFTPDEQLQPPKLPFSGEDSFVDPGTPNSVIRHPVSVSPEPEMGETESIGESSKSAASSSRDPRTETTGASDLMHDAGLQPALDIQTNTEKRISSLVRLELPAESNIDEGGIGLGLGLEKEFDRVVEAQKVEFELSLQRLYHPFHGRFPSGETSPSKHLCTSMSGASSELYSLSGVRASLDMPRPLSPFKHHDMDFQANKNFSPQRGYLMRQNTKIVIASERTSQDEAPLRTIADTPGIPTQPNEVHTSTRKASQPTWTAEPWNSKPRRKSIKLGGEKAIAKRKPADGPVPPLPGFASNVNDGLESVVEDEFAEEEAEEFEDGVERGRLFVKVVGVKDLQLPFPQRRSEVRGERSQLTLRTDERTYFALTLDNGLHCVTTAWLDLGKQAPIGQEFELVVLNELEFQLTLQMKLDEPKIERPVSPTKPPPSPKKQSALGRLFGSPKKKKESEIHFSDVQSMRPVTPPSAYELVQGLVAKDGSFARAYVSLNEHEKYAYGRPYSVDIKCFNEWAMEQVPVGSSRSKKSVVELQRRPPYEIGKLELQLLYIPKPKGAKEEEMPKSMNSAIRALRDAEDKTRQHAAIKEFEGYLSQQGGDCPFWRRRFFKLVGTKLTAYHETTLQPRATINLAKATKIINDKTSLTQKETSTKGGGRRKSGFAEEEDGYMFVEEGFRIRFANGEVIDFYADSTATKEEWMVALSQVVGKGINTSTTHIKGWTEMVLKREKNLERKAKAEAQARKAKFEDQNAIAEAPPRSTPSGIPIALTKPMPPLPRPSGHARSESYEAGGHASRSTANSPVKRKLTSEERRLKARSMVF